MGHGMEYRTLTQQARFQPVQAVEHQFHYPSRSDTPGHLRQLSF